MALGGKKEKKDQNRSKTNSETKTEATSIYTTNILVQNRNNTTDYEKKSIQFKIFMKVKKKQQSLQRKLY